MSIHMGDMKPELPNSIEGEQAVIGAVFLNNDAYHVVSQFLKAEHFYHKIHRTIWETVTARIDAGKAANPITIKQFLPVEDKVGDLTAYEYAIRLATNAVTVINAKDYAEAVYEAYELRQIIINGTEAIQSCYSPAPEMTAVDIASQLEEKLAALRSDSPKEEGPGTAKAAVARILDRHRRNEKAPCIGLPLQQIHEVLNGDMEVGNLYGLLSSSGEGKTSLVLQIIDYAASNGHPVLFLSYDQSSDQCIEQMASQRLGIDNTRIRERTMTEREYERFYAEMFKIQELPWETKRCSREGTTQLAGHVRRFRKRYPEGNPLIVLDHVRKVTPRDPRAHEGRIASEVNGFCKAMAVEVGAVWLNLNQRNSGGMKRDNPRPISSDIFGGEQAKEDYDAILYLYRPDKYKEDQLRIAKNEKERSEIDIRFDGWRDQAEIGALKTRFGDSTIRRRLRFEKECTRYVSMRDQGEATFEGMGF